MEEKRQFPRTKRFTKRLEATFSSGEFTYRGILSDISQSGLFIRTNRGFAPGTSIEISIMMPEDRISRLKGIVRRTVKTPMSTMKNGMGVELTEKDALFMNLLKTYTEEADQDSLQEDAHPGGETPYPEFELITCTACGVKNKVPYKKISLGPKCGRCGTPLNPGSL